MENRWWSSSFPLQTVGLSYKTTVFFICSVWQSVTLLSASQAESSVSHQNIHTAAACCCQMAPQRGLSQHFTKSGCQLSLCIALTVWSVFVDGAHIYCSYIFKQFRIVLRRKCFSGNPQQFQCICNTQHSKQKAWLIMYRTAADRAVGPVLLSPNIVSETDRQTLGFYICECGYPLIT